MNNNAMRVEWDDNIPKEVEEAKSLYIKARQESRSLSLLDGTLLKSFRPYHQAFIIKESEMSDTQFSVRFHDKTGDRRLIWDTSCPEEVLDAQKHFEDYLSKGWRAYTTNKDGKKGRRIYGFNPNSLEIFFDEKSAKDNLKSFVDKMGVFIKETKSKSNSDKIKNFVHTLKNTKVFPRTYPG